MTEEALIPRMKRLNKKQRKIKIPILNFTLILFGVLLLVMSTFINIEFKHYILPESFFAHEILDKEDFIFSFGIIPQIPILMFVCSSLGKRMATTSVCLYILCGLFLFPVFALGGGLNYILQYSFGYIFAYIPAVLISGTFLRRKYSFLNMFIAALIAVLIIHLSGITYMSLIALIKGSGLNFIKGWINAQSGLKIIYDLILSFVLILIGKYIHSFIKFVND